MIKPIHRSSSSKAGFTLIEMLVAMALMVGILSALATITAQWLPNWNHGFQHVQRTELFGRGLERLVSDLSAAEYVTASGYSKKPLFEGDELSVRFVRPAIGPNTRPGLEVISVTTQSDDRSTALVRTRAPFVPLPENGRLRDLSNFSDPVVLIRSPYRATFSYAGSNRVWQTAWHNTDDLPVAVRVLVRDAATHATLAVSTVALLRVNVSPVCARVDEPVKCVYPPPASGDANASKTSAPGTGFPGALPVSPNLDK